MFLPGTLSYDSIKCRLRAAAVSREPSNLENKMMICNIRGKMNEYINTPYFPREEFPIPKRQ